MQFQAKTICEGLAVAPVFIYKKFKLEDVNVKNEGVEQETAKFELALSQAMEQLKELYLKTLRELGKEKSLLFEVHQMLMQDDDYISEIRTALQDGLAAPYAVKNAGETFAAMMSAMGDEYMKERALDFRDISNRLIKILCNVKDEGRLSVPSIVIAEDLEPSETVAFDKSLIKGFALKYGSANSHTAILARGMNVPAVIQSSFDMDSLQTGVTMILDAFKGVMVYNPSAEEVQSYEEKFKAQEAEAKDLETYRGKLTYTKSGKKIKLYNNIGSLADLEKVKAFDGEGVGLFRSEFLYMGRTDLPSEEEQFQIYKKATETLGDKMLIVRTMDIGADKKVDSLDLKKEENPALGRRAIRICLTDLPLFYAQLRALIRASAFGNLAIMFPMIISVEEILECKKHVQMIMQEFDEKGIAYNKNLSIGIMIETPAAVVLADEMAKHVEFFSVGTNDLTQYTLAVDRQNEEIAHLYDAKHPAVMKMLKMIAESAVNNGIWAGICGELGSDMSVTEELLSYGFTELSVSPGQTLKLRKLISNIE